MGFFPCAYLELTDFGVASFVFETSLPLEATALGSDGQFGSPLRLSKMCLVEFEVFVVSAFLGRKIVAETLHDGVREAARA